MLNTILGSKGQMSQAVEGDIRIPVTKIKAGPCVVTQIKSHERDGYWAIQLGFGEKKIGKISKPVKGHLKAATKDKKMAARFLREVKVAEEPKERVGDKIKVSDILGIGDEVSVTGISKGKGFAGLIKRWGFSARPRTHGHSGRRVSGSIGQGTTPGRVHKGKKMAGRMGTDRVTVKNLKVVSVDSEKQEIEVSGPVPGTPGSLLIIKRLKERGNKNG